MSAPSWYGETITTYDDTAVRLVAEMGGRVRQDELLTELSHGFDSYRTGALNGARRAIEDGRLVMVWDSYGFPYYETAAAATA